MQSKASRDVAVVNTFLHDNNFNIQLDDLKNTYAFYVASILKVVLEWENVGTRTTLTVDGKDYPAVHFDKEDDQQFKIFNVLNDPSSSDQANQILEITAKNGDVVYMMQDHRNCLPLTGFSLLDVITNIWQKNITEEHHDYSYQQAIFPMVDIDQEVNISWLKDMEACDVYKIVQALQQTKFQMNEKGAKVESAVAISFVDACYRPEPPKVFTVNDAFYLWIVRPGMKTPIFAAYIDKDAWKAPQE